MYYLPCRPFLIPSFSHDSRVHVLPEGPAITLLYVFLTDPPWLRKRRLRYGCGRTFLISHRYSRCHELPMSVYYTLAAMER